MEGPEGRLPGTSRFQGEVREVNKVLICALHGIETFVEDNFKGSRFLSESLLYLTTEVLSARFEYQTCTG